jgi:hypothetical protein
VTAAWTLLDVLIVLGALTDIFLTCFIPLVKNGSPGSFSRRCGAPPETSVDGSARGAAGHRCLMDLADPARAVSASRIGLCERDHGRVRTYLA